MNLFSYHVRNRILNVIDCNDVRTVCLSHRAQRLEVVGNSVIAGGFVPAVLSETGGA